MSPIVSPTPSPLPTRMLTLVVLVLTALLLALVPTSAADAAGKKTQSYSTTGMRASLTVDFKSKYEWTVQGWVEDVCPSDGRGVYMGNPDGLVKAKKGGWKVVVGWFGQVYDNNGCGNGKSKLKQVRMTQGSKKKAFQALRIKVCASNGSQDPNGLCYVRVWYNPYY